MGDRADALLVCQKIVKEKGKDELSVGIGYRRNQINRLKHSLLFFRASFQCRRISEKSAPRFSFNHLLDTGVVVHLTSWWGED